MINIFYDQNYLLKNLNKFEDFNYESCLSFVYLRMISNLMLLRNFYANVLKIVFVFGA